MKLFSFLIIFLLLIGCSNGDNNQIEDNKNINDTILGYQLYETGFLKYSDSLKRDSLKYGLTTSFDIYNEDNNKIAHIDAEELAEFSFDFFLPDLNRLLAKRKFELIVKTAHDVESSNDILINDVKINLYTKEELSNGHLWESAPKNFFKEVNRQLNAKNIEESFYLLYGGNDLHVLLLTSNEFKIIKNKYRDDSKEIPYLP
ncbi:MAG: hypothetical protein ACK40G_18325 [Cytophagaceae bacterium]